jgi:hypothetical protein
VEIETPNVETGVGQFISPGAAVETMGDRQGRREEAAVDISTIFGVSVWCAFGGM